MKTQQQRIDSVAGDPPRWEVPSRSMRQGQTILKKMMFLLSQEI